MQPLKTNTVKAGLAAALVAVSALCLFVPVAPGSDDVKSMFLLLTGIAVRDYFGSVQSDKRVADVQNALAPPPQESYVAGQE